LLSLICEIEFKKTVESNVDLLLSIVAYGISFLTAIFVRVQIQRRMYTSWVYALFALVLSSFLSFAVLINFFRKLEVDGTVGSSAGHFWRQNGDFSMVYLSCLFILTLFNGLSTFVYCQFIRILDLSWTPVRSPPSNQSQEGPNSRDDLPPSYDDFMKNPKSYPVTTM